MCRHVFIPDLTHPHLIEFIIIPLFCVSCMAKNKNVTGILNCSFWVLYVTTKQNLAFIAICNWFYATVWLVHNCAVQRNRVWWCCTLVATLIVFLIIKVALWLGSSSINAHFFAIHKFWGINDNGTLSDYSEMHKLKALAYSIDTVHTVW